MISRRDIYMGRLKKGTKKYAGGLDGIAERAIERASKKIQNCNQKKKNPQEKLSLSPNALLWCQLMANRYTIDNTETAEGGKRLSDIATEVYKQVRPAISYKSAASKAATLLADPRCQAKIDAIRIAQGLTADIILADRQQIHDKVMAIANIILDDELTELNKKKELKDQGQLEGPIYDAKSSLLSSGRLMQVNMWMLEHARTFGFHPTLQPDAGQTTNNLIISPTKEVEDKVLRALETLKKVETKEDTAHNV
jgi:hypothetical protein